MSFLEGHAANQMRLAQPDRVLRAPGAIGANAWAGSSYLGFQTADRPGDAAILDRCSPRLGHSIASRQSFPWSQSNIVAIPIVRLSR